MLILEQLLHRGLTVIPRKSVLIEVAGFALLGFGLLLGLSIYTYHPGDSVALSEGLNQVQNMGGLVGARLADSMLGLLGLVIVVWPMLLSIWGLLIVVGFQVHPQVKHVVGFLTSMMVASAMVHVQLSYWGFNRPSFGFGGKFGDAYGAAALRNFGYGGATIVLATLGLLALVLTGNLAVSRIKNLVIFAYKRSLSAAKIAAAQLRGEEELSDEELIKQALVAELKQSTSLSRKKATTTERSSNEPVSMANNVQKATAQKRSEKLPATLNLVELAEEVEQELINADGNLTSDGAKLNFYYDGKPHSKPEASLFSRSSKPKERVAEFKKMAEKLAHQLAQFKVDGKVSKIVEGPVVTTFEFEPVPGTKVSKITGLSQDLARLLQANSLRILAPIPGKKVVGFEVPNAERRTIGFADLIAHRDLKLSKIQLPVAMGVDAFGNVVIEDLAKMPHLLVAGSTGSGKSVFMNTLIGGLIARHTAKDLRFVMIDPKMVELAAYNTLPHMACPVITDPAGEAKEKLDALVSEMEDRFRKMQAVGARNIQGFNEIIKKSKRTDFPEFTDKWQTMPFIVLIIDELADMMMQLGKDAEVPITRLAQKARAAGMHLVIATQRPSADVVTGLIKANFPTRVAFRVLSGLDSRTILDTSGAEGLIGQGDMLFLNAAGLRRMHGAYLSDSEVHAMVKATRK